MRAVNCPGCRFLAQEGHFLLLKSAFCCDGGRRTNVWCGAGEQKADPHLRAPEGGPQLRKGFRGCGVESEIMLGLAIAV